MSFPRWSQLKQRFDQSYQSLHLGHGLVLLLLLLLLASAQAVIHWTHASRGLQVRLQILHTERDALQVEWGRLLLEESTLVSPARLEQQADQQLGLRFPERKDVRIKRVSVP
ncbi:cell division protein FtsL [Marinospirillum sp. MEB164]|uniref:Cell division protein FtsL n=1 Tax=Marinospirillum alkalitolerans TaxID=3123374 RepID=A0ABW8PXD2_9GAMM